MNTDVLTASPQNSAGNPLAFISDLVVPAMV